MGAVGLLGYLTVFVISLFINVMMSSSTLGPSGTFWIFGLVSIVAAVWMHLNIIETSKEGLTDIDKKQIYSTKSHTSHDDKFHKSNQSI